MNAGPAARPPLQPWPDASQFNEAVQNLASAIDDPELQGGEAELGQQGMPMPYAGNFADVYKVYCPKTKNTWAVKFFKRQVRDLQDRYRAISDHLIASQLPFTETFRYLDSGVRIGGQRYPILKMKWIEGVSLSQFVEQSLDQPRMLDQLQALWLKVAQRLREVKIAHADLQHGNVVLVPGSGGKLLLKLIDYDGMFVPALAGQGSNELGHANYQHPQRQATHAWHVELDRFSHLVICTALRCLRVVGRTLWDRYSNDNLLFSARDFAEPRSSPLFQELWKVDDAEVRALVGRLALATQRPLEETPLLDQVLSNGRPQPLTGSELDAVNDLLGLASAVRPPAATAAEPSNLAASPILPAASLPPAAATAPAVLPQGKRPIPIVVQTPTPEDPAVQPLPRSGFAHQVARIDASLAGFAGVEVGSLSHHLLRTLVVLVLAAGVTWAIVFVRSYQEPALNEAVASQPDPAPRKRSPRKPTTDEIDSAIAEFEAAIAAKDATAAILKYGDLSRLLPDDSRLGGWAGQVAGLNQEPAAPPVEAFADSSRPPEPPPREENPSPPPEDPPSGLPEVTPMPAPADPTLLPPIDEKTFENSIGMKFVAIPLGEYVMGVRPDEAVKLFGVNPANEKGELKTDVQHRVRLTRPFMMGVTEVTQRQWRDVMKTTPWASDLSLEEGDDFPAVEISWHAAVEFCKTLSALERRSYRLPTEAEWEYGCRAGTTTVYFHGDDWRGGLEEYAWIRTNRYGPVGAKKPNAWGLHDMHGNVWEWCSDWYAPFTRGAVVDPQGPPTGDRRVLRSGGYGSIYMEDHRSAKRVAMWPDVGQAFRVVLDSAPLNPRARLADLNVAIAKVQLSLATYQFAQAQTALSQAEELVTTPEQKAYIARGKKVATLGQEFRDEIESVLVASGGRPFQAGPVRLQLSNALRKEVRVQTAKSTYVVSLDRLPMLFAFGIWDHKHKKEDQRGHLLKGAYAYAGIPQQQERNEALAKSHWKDAGPEGEDLLKLFTEEFDFGAEGKPEP